jgi:hypothetical protein
MQLRLIPTLLPRPPEDSMALSPCKLFGGKGDGGGGWRGVLARDFSNSFSSFWVIRFQFFFCS